MAKTTIVEPIVTSNIPTIMDVADNFIPILERALFAPELPIERIIAIKEMIFEAREEEKKRQYYDAVTKAQALMPKIMKSHYNSQTNSYYENLEDVLDAIQPVLDECGLAVMCGEAAESPLGAIKIFYEIMHKAGYSKTFYYTCPLDNKGIKGNVNKTDIMGQGSSVSYGRRYLHKMVWNLNTGDDNDGQSFTPAKQTYQRKAQYEAMPAPAPIVMEYIDAAQKASLIELIDEAESNLDIIYRAYNIACLDDMTTTMYERATAKLQTKIQELTKPQGEDECPSA